VFIPGIIFIFYIESSVGYYSRVFAKKKSWKNSVTPTFHTRLTH
jgi:hypothetical protein